MKSRKSKIHTKVYLIPELKFEEQKLTAYSGLIIFQVLFQNLNLKSKLLKCFAHINISSIFGHHTIFMFLIVHLLIGFRKIRDRDYYHEDPLVKRLLGISKIPDTSTISRNLKLMDESSFNNTRNLNIDIIGERIVKENFRRLTLDFDGSVISTTRKAEGSAVGYNKIKKGARSYYPLFCTLAQTGQIFDFKHRAGNVHDSNGSKEFMIDCFKKIRNILSRSIIESRVDSAFFNEDVISMMDSNNIEFTASVPFDRYAELKTLIESRQRWQTIDETWSYFESEWKPKCWNEKFRFIFIRQKVSIQRKGALQLDLFEPKDHEYEFKVIVTNKKVNVKSVLLFHNGRGSQEGIFAQAKTQAQLDYTPTNSLNGNRIFMAAVVLTHNLTREIQMQLRYQQRNTNRKRAAHWVFESLSSIRNKIIHRAGRFINPQGKLTLILNANTKVQKEFTDYLSAMKAAA